MEFYPVAGVLQGTILNIFQHVFRPCMTEVRTNLQITNYNEE